MKKHSKDHVLSIGEALFRTQGYFNTGTKDILKKAAYPRSSFYYLFKKVLLLNIDFFTKQNEKIENINNILTQSIEYFNNKLFDGLYA